ncbi:MAG: Hpt domain-containing protein [Prochloron sp. SP5CPC1]|nr:Hpt domain-containing protein [Candidatus Paraprochloron terpiosi SP5CPC1]
MTFQLDQATLQSITQEVRQCFLELDAPEYMKILERGLENRDGDFKSLLRAAHSLKGGAGVSELPSLHNLAHKLEDLLQIMEKGEVQVDILPTGGCQCNCPATGFRRFLRQGGRIIS